MTPAIRIMFRFLLMLWSIFHSTITTKYLGKRLIMQVSYREPLWCLHDFLDMDVYEQFQNPMSKESYLCIVEPVNLINHCHPKM